MKPETGRKKAEQQEVLPRGARQDLPGAPEAAGQREQAEGRLREVCGQLQHRQGQVRGPAE